MTQSQLLARRKLLTGALMLAVALPTIGASRARAANTFDGSWGGLDANGETAQLLFSSGDIIGFYWRGDYMDVSNVKLGAGGASISFFFSGGAGQATRTGARSMTLVIHDQRLGERKVELKKD
jgi:hypothetical protein